MNSFTKIQQICLKK